MKKCTGENCPMQIGYDVEKCAAAWEKVFEIFDKADVRGVELAAILTPERRK